MPYTVASVQLVAPGSSRVATPALVVSPFRQRDRISSKRALERFPNAKFEPDRVEPPWFNVAQCLGEITASLAAAAYLALSITVVSFFQTALATFSKPVGDQRKSLLGFETRAVEAR